MASTVPHHCHYSALALLFSSSTGDNLTVRGQDCRVDAATMSVQNLWLPLWFPNLCIAWNFHVEATLPTFFSWDKTDQDEHSDFLASIWYFKVHWCPLDQEFSNSNTILIPKDYNHNLSSQWHSGISYSLELYCGAIPSSAFQNGGSRFHPPWQSVTVNPHHQYHKRSAMATFLVPLHVSVRIHGTQRAQTFEQQSSLITALHYFHQWIAGTQLICFYVMVTVYQFMKLADVV